MRVFTLLAITILSAFASRAQAHPHVWVDYNLHLQYANGKLIAVRQHWVFDEAFTNMLLSDLAKDHKKGQSLSPQHVKALYKNAFNNLKNYNYFTHIWVHKKPVATATVTNFSARVRNNRLEYTFVLPLSTPINRLKSLEIGVWDTTYYTDVAPAKAQKSAVSFNKGGKSCKANHFKNKNQPIYFGTVYPLTYKIHCL